MATLSLNNQDAWDPPKKHLTTAEIGICKAAHPNTCQIGLPTTKPLHSSKQFQTHNLTMTWN